MFYIFPKGFSLKVNVWLVLAIGEPLRHMDTLLRVSTSWAILMLILDLVSEDMSQYPPKHQPLQIT